MAKAACKPSQNPGKADVFLKERLWVQTGIKASSLDLLPNTAETEIRLNCVTIQYVL